MSNVLESYPLNELKLVYRVLQAQLAFEPDLMDSQFLHECQTYLQNRAKEDGIDVSLHAQWAEWLNQT